MTEPTPQEIAELIERNPLVAYLVKQLGGRVVRITRRHPQWVPKTKRRPSSPPSKPRAA